MLLKTVDLVNLDFNNSDKQNSIHLSVLYITSRMIIQRKKQNRKPGSCVTLHKEYIAAGYTPVPMDAGKWFSYISLLSSANCGSI